MGFKGKYLNKFDSAGRISLPAKMRDELKKNFEPSTLVIYYAVVSKCLKIVTGRVYEDKIEKKYAETQPQTRKEAEVYKLMVSSAEDIEINSSGRISVPALLREKAGLGEECYFIGVNDIIEVWNKETWEENAKRIEEDIIGTASGMEKGIDFLMF